MTWAYRIVRRKVDKIYVYGIHEIYYDKGKVEMLTQTACEPFGETLNELIADFELQRRAFNLPIIDYKTMKEIK